MRERMLQAMLLAVVGLALFAAFRPASTDPQDDKKVDELWFNLNKIHQRVRYDGVVLGDSRALHGVAPEEMEKELSGRTVFNFAFQAGSFNPEIYAAADKLLDHEAEPPFYVLALTALSFQARKSHNDEYHQYLSKPRDVVELSLHFRRLTELFQPVAPGVFVRRVLNIQPSHRIYEDFLPTGWIATHQVPAVTVENIPELEKQMREEGEIAAIDPALVDGLVARTRRWTDRGVRVFACLMPAAPGRVEAECRVLGLDVAKLRRDFEAAGGTWLAPDVSGLTTYDASHLDAASAREFSLRLGKLIHEML